MTGFERQQSLFGPYERSRCLQCGGVSREVATAGERGQAVLDRWERDHDAMHQQAGAA